MSTLEKNETYSEINENAEVYESIDLTGVKASSSNFTKVTFANSNLSYSRFFQSKFVGCKFIGTKYNGAELEGCTFIDCRIEMTSFMHSKVKDLKFEDCTFIDVDYRSTNIENLTFTKCELNKIDFSGATLAKRLDVSTSTIVEVIGFSGLKGLVVSESQYPVLAPFMAKELGFIVKKQD